LEKNMNKICAIIITSLLITTSAFAKNETPAEANKRNANAFCEALANDKNFDKAREYIGDRYIQHDPKIEDGIDGLKKYFNFLTKLYPNMHTEIVRTTADDNFAYVHMRVVLIPGTRGDAMVDIFRFENGKIVEHWDVLQEIPAFSRNENGMM
jgi:predicted SnoaL-like aldol condensation-catalyzing enzyme